jgi:hypothetical protein
MKNLSSLRHALITILILLATTAISFAQEVATVPLYRVFAHTTGIHFYTTDVNRKLEAVGAGWSSEGTAAFILTQQAPGTVPLYVLQTRVRFGDFKTPGEAVFGYVVDPQERDNLLNTPGMSSMLCGAETAPGSGKAWWYDATGVAGYIAATQLPGTVPLYRLYHPPDFGPEETYRMSAITIANTTQFRRCRFGSFDNLYTTSEKEKASAITKHGYKFVSIIGYVWPTASTVSMQPPAPAKHTPIITTANEKPFNVDTFLLKAGCLRTGVGQYGCANLGAFNACKIYMKDGLTKGCTYTADAAAKAAQKEMDDKLFSLGCTHLLGRSDEFLCKTPNSFNACEEYRKGGKAKRCLMAKQ